MRIIVIFALAFFFSLGLASALNATVCCEKTTSGFYCQNVPATECASGARQAQTACSSTSFCKPGVCYNTAQGTCLDNTPQLVCNLNNGTWSATSPPQCNLGCCLLGDQAAFVTLTRCKYLSGTLGLATNFDKSIQTELQCVRTAQAQEKGACVYDYEFQRTCKFTTRDVCELGVNGTKAKGEFFAGMLCTAPELGTICAKTSKTICAPGREEVYFVDSCGNPANIYDASRLDDQVYWSKIMDKSETCNPNSGNILSKNCGNCNYLQGSYCRSVSKSTSVRPVYGNAICADLNCPASAESGGKARKHGESWCVYNDKGESGEGNNAVGSRFYKHICVSGQVVLEQCADYRQEECIEDSISTPVGEFSQAACRVNRWQDCTAQTNAQDCENTDRRDCYWKTGISLGNSSGGACLPKNTPGLKFWEGEDAKAICAQANAACIVTFEKGLFGGETCKKNCDCLGEEWEKQHAAVCMALGDCGSKINWIGSDGYKLGYEKTIGKVKSKK